ncbi:hypothetical protein K491DRAFT_698414 [Lophiostoma macrostomum CBS 122681]|uniref:Uncharacterized protein n=1 Tax=Lophiostoma macrostomum CBS 122681 TaxID=1314788 RepID=A0A6A6SMK4_9PLEO|nr:hypothetical protein K491DRAFT_698414 [Lophiostoma macrostomum CBS 122681]
MSSRTLHVYHDDWKHSHAHILDSDKNTTLYTMDIQTRKPNITFFRSASTSALGTADIGYMGNELDFTLNSQPLHLEAKDWRKAKFLYSSSFFRGTASWNIGTKSTTLLSEAQLPLAKCSLSTMAMKKVGTIEIMDELMPQEGIDEIAIMGTALMMKYVNGHIITAAKTAAASSAGAAAAAASVTAAISG